jgi:23S rRNA pseudouridine955/2504/2580 synthase
MEERMVRHLKRSVLHEDADMLVINKPAGLPVQGGEGITVSVDALLPHLRLSDIDAPRLAAHRLT